MKVVAKLASTVGLYLAVHVSMGKSVRQCGGECYTLAVNVEKGPAFHSHSS